METPNQPRREHLLIVEDNSSQRRVLVDLMEEEGFEVVGCETAAEALLYLERVEFGVAIVDLSLPDSTGIQLLERLRETQSHIRVIIYTAYGSFDSAKDALNLGAFAYVEKLASPATLVSHVHRAFRDRLSSYASDLETAVSEQTSSLIASEKKYRELFESCGDAILLLQKTDGHIVDANPRTMEMLGYDRQTLFDMESRDLLPKTEQSKAKALISQLQRDELVTSEGDLHCIRHDGTQVPVNITASTMGTEENRLVMVHARDITERKRAEETLQRAHDELELRVKERTAKLSQTNKDLQQEMADRQLAEERARQRQAELAHVLRLFTMGEMASGLAHELNQPLAAIMNYTRGSIRWLQSDHEKTEEVLDAMRQVGIQADRAGKIIRRIRSLTQKHEPQQSPVDINHVVKDVADFMNMEARSVETAINLELTDDLPNVLADSIQIEQVIVNLAMNACDAMRDHPSKDREVIIRTSSVAGDLVEVAVRDSGPGVTDKVASRLFEPFFTTKEHGMGIGLSISRSIIEAHHGRLWMTPNEEKGVSFQFTLPVSVEPGRH